jgi:hypothetical protein
MTNKNIDQAKGRVKEAAGALAGDRHLKNKGRVDQPKAPQRTLSTRLATPSPAETGNRGARACVQPDPPGHP